MLWGRSGRDSHKVQPCHDFYYSEDKLWPIFSMSWAPATFGRFLRHLERPLKNLVPSFVNPESRHRNSTAHHLWGQTQRLSLWLSVCERHVGEHMIKWVSQLPGVTPASICVSCWQGPLLTCGFLHPWVYQRPHSSRQPIAAQRPNKSVACLPRSFLWHCYLCREEQRCRRAMGSHTRCCLVALSEPPVPPIPWVWRWYKHLMRAEEIPQGSALP